MSDSKPRELFTVEFQSKTLGTSVFLTRADAEQFANIFKDDPDVRQHPWIVRWVESPQGSAMSDSRPRELFTVGNAMRANLVAKFLDQRRLFGVYRAEAEDRGEDTSHWAWSNIGEHARDFIGLWAPQEEDAELWARDQVVAVRDKLNAVLAEWPQS